MIELVIGGSGSGKSEYAEELARLIGDKLYYLATMIANDEEGLKRVHKHQKNREGKGFITIEKPRDIIKLPMFDKEYVLLLECMTNLVANEMFADKSIPSVDEVVDKIINDIEALEDRFKTLVIVTGNVFEDGASYDELTMDYIKALAKINNILAKKSHHVTELVAGIPIRVK